MLSYSQLKLATPHTSMDLATHFLEMLTQPSVNGGGILAELQLRIYWCGGGVDEEPNMACLS